MRDIKTTMYIIVDKRGTGYLPTLNYKRGDCISGFLRDSKASWSEAKKSGWKCKKVDVTISSATHYWQ